LDDWNEDKMRLNKRSLRAESSAFQEKAQGRPAAARPAGEAATPAAMPPPALAPPAVPASRLEVMTTPDGTNVGRSYPINAAPFTLGRSGNNLDLVYNGVSRSHAVLSFRDGQFFLRDVGSTNGTSINGQNITGRGEVVLPAGAEVSVGLGVTLRFVVE
jgi:hypothetical protein